MQTGASALLAAAAVTTLYGLVHFFDLFRNEPSITAEPQRIEFERPAQAEPVPDRLEFGAPAVVEPRLAVDNAVEAVEDVQPVEQLSSPVKANRKAKAPRKSTSRRANARKEIAIPEAALANEVDREESALSDETESVETETVEDVPHVHHAPLFEPDPYVRMPRQAFGRRGQI